MNSFAPVYPSFGDPGFWSGGPRLQNEKFDTWEGGGAFPRITKRLGSEWFCTSGQNQAGIRSRIFVMVPRPLKQKADPCACPRGLKGGADYPTHSAVVDVFVVPVDRSPSTLIKYPCLRFDVLTNNESWDEGRPCFTPHLRPIKAPVFHPPLSRNALYTCTFLAGNSSTLR